MTTTSVLFCLAALLTIYSHAAGSINCRIRGSSSLVKSETSAFISGMSSCPHEESQKKFVYHPKCRGVAAKRSDLPALVSHRRPHVDRKQAFHPMCRGVQVKRARTPGHHILHNTTPRKLEEELPEPEYTPESVDVTNEVLQAMPRRNPALWNYLGDRPANLLLARRTLDQEPLPLELTYDYE